MYLVKNNNLCCPLYHSIKDRLIKLIDCFNDSRIRTYNVDYTFIIQQS